MYASSLVKPGIANTLHLELQKTTDQNLTFENLPGKVLVNMYLSTISLWSL